MCARECVCVCVRVCVFTTGGIEHNDSLTAFNSEFSSSETGNHTKAEEPLLYITRIQQQI